ncbi:MAG TPA: cell envelope integrity protein TolA [Gammaproteobacteria bacterium]
MQIRSHRLRPWAYSLLLHAGLVLFMVLSFRWGNSVVPALSGQSPEAEPVKATVVDQHLIDQQLSMLKAEQQKKQQERQQLEQNITDLRQQQASAERQMNQQAADMKAQADRLAKLKAEDEKLSQQKKTRDSATRRAQLQAEIASEERARNSRLASLASQYVALIKQKVTNNWIRPPSTPDNLNCVVLVSQVQGGTVTDVNFGDCNGDDVVRESIRTAVYRASPLPAPPDPSLFDKNVKFIFDKKN